MGISLGSGHQMPNPREDIDDAILKSLQGDHPPIRTLNEISKMTGLDMDTIKDRMAHLLRYHRIEYDQVEGYTAYDEGGV